MIMTPEMRQLARKRLDARLAAVMSIPLTTHLMPRHGWIHTIREALGMPSHELARRMCVNEQTVRQMELNEAKGKLAMDSLAQAAEALECDLVVVLVPRRPLEQVVNDRRAQLVSSWLQTRVLQTMALSGQAVSQGDLPSMIVKQVEQLFPDEQLWSTG
ncbi:helix-turn-helix domain-containing protein [Stenotrophomonas terrae]|uniref:helix-turn-helix domain-containing protein n=1 Tax=Stenotrophomonas terrae TaxID=405446 RepID=UPI00320B38F9